MSHLALGEQGEILALHYLKQRGYRIVARNYRCPLGEIDIIARHRGVVVFVEVKSRSSKAFGVPAMAITAAKRHKLSQVAWYYLQRHNLTDASARFDVVSVSNIRSTPKIELIENAFETTF